MKIIMNSTRIRQVYKLRDLDTNNPRKYWKMMNDKSSTKTEATIEDLYRFSNVLIKKITKKI